MFLSTRHRGGVSHGVSHGETPRVAARRVAGSCEMQVKCPTASIRKAPWAAREARSDDKGRAPGELSEVVTPAKGRGSAEGLDCKPMVEQLYKFLDLWPLDLIGRSMAWGCFLGVWPQLLPTR